VGINAPVLESIDIGDGRRLILPHPDAAGILLTGPITGEVVIGDTKYDLSPDAVAVTDPDHLAHLGHRIGTLHVSRGTFGDLWVPQDADPYAGAEMYGVFSGSAVQRLSTEYAGGVAPAFASQRLHCLTGDPGRTSLGSTEVSGGGYTFQAITFGTAASNASGATLASNSTVTFSNMPATTVVAVAEGGVGATNVETLQISIALASSVALLVGQSLTFATGAVTITHG
jgi:hypothetical protein